MRRMDASYAVAVLVLGAFASTGSWLPGQQPDGSGLRKAADAVVQLEDVQARGRVDEIFRYSDWLLEHGPKKEAVRYLKAGLKIHAWRLDQQMKLARALEDTGDKDGAVKAAEIVAARGEEDGPYRDALLLLGRPIPDTRFAPLDGIPDSTPALVLLPLGELDELLLGEVAEALHRKLGIDVLIRRLEWTLPPAGRDPHAEYLESIREDLRRKEADPTLLKALDRHGAKLSDLDGDAKLLEVCRTWAELAGGPEAAATFDTNVRLSAMRRQWDAVRLRELVHSKTGTLRKRGVAYLAVTRGDIYANDYNFLFAQASGSIGVVSYARFRAAFNDESPDRKRLVARFLKQGLASAGHVFGLDRCSSPLCARAFPIGLEEHDAKPDEPCAECKAAFDRAFQAVR